MKIALIQSSATAQKHANIERAFDLTLHAIHKKAKFILLPEIFNFRGLPDTRRGFSKIAEKIPGESAVPFMIIARACRVSILLGSLYEKVSGSPKVYNTSVLINDRGELQAAYRKIHLFDAVVDGKVISESRSFLRGHTPALAPVQDFTIGLSICYDVRFPELYRYYSKKGANVLCVPSVFTKATGQAHWETLLRSRAIENLSYVLAPNQAGQGSKPFPRYGHSMVIDPWGKVIARGSLDKEEIIYANIQMDAILQARKKLPGVLLK